MRKPRTPYLKLFINIQSNRRQHVHVHTLLPASALRLSSLQDLHTATHIHVSTYRLHFILYNIYQTNTYTEEIIYSRFPTPAHLQFNTSISSSSRKQQTSKIKIKTFKQNFKGVQNYVTNRPTIQQPHSINLFKIYLILYFNYRLPVFYCILVVDYTCNNFNFGQLYFLIFYVGKLQNGLMMVLVTETCSR
jgi:hypothetical protein